MFKMTEEEDELKTEVRGGVGCILLNRHFDQILITYNQTFFIFIARPKKLNCLSLAMIRKMTKTVKEWNQKNSGVQVVVVRGAGENFMSGRWGRMAKIGFFGQKPKFWAQKKAFTFCP